MMIKQGQVKQRTKAIRKREILAGDGHENKAGPDLGRAELRWWHDGVFFWHESSSARDGWLEYVGSGGWETGRGG